MTFHSLCTTCLPARDDVQMRHAVESAERGRCDINVPCVEQILVDEVQDVRELYIRLLRVLGLLKNRVVIAGDRNQLIYDFDEEFPASLDAISRPHECISRGRWARITMSHSHRLTQPMTLMVNHMFGTCIESGRPGRPIEIRCPRNKYNLSETLPDLLHVGTSILLLVDRKRKPVASGTSQRRVAKG